MSQHQQVHAFRPINKKAESAHSQPSAVPSSVSPMPFPSSQPQQSMKPVSTTQPSSNQTSSPMPPPRNNAPVSDSTETKRTIKSHGYKIHGGKAALEIKVDEKVKNRDQGIVDENGEQNVFYTIRLEAAKSLGPRNYDWQNKTVIQLTDIELPLFIAVCLGYFPSIEFGNHGVGHESNTKSFNAKHQGMSVFISLGQKDQPMKGVPVPLPQALMIAHIALSQYKRNFPTLDSQTLLNNIGSMANFYLQNGKQLIKDKLPN